jgi:hypothetical protein
MMARRYSKKASAKVERAMKKRKGRDSEERSIRSQGQESQAGDRDRSFGGEGGRQEGPEEGFEEREEQEAQGEKVVCFNRHCEEPTDPAFGGPTSLRGETRRSNPLLLCGAMDCFAEPCHRARTRATHWLAMTI